MGIIAGLIDLLFPRYCPVCGKLLETDEHPLCLICNLELPRLNFFDNPHNNYVAQLFRGKTQPYGLEKAASFMRFIPHSGPANIVYDAKYHGLAEIGEGMGVIMAQEAAEKGFFEGIDYLIPVPITISRMLHRGYNQSERIAKGISKVTGIPVLAKSVLRTRFDKSQTKLSPTERKQNVKAVFCVADVGLLSNKHVLIVEDIITTGSTISSLVNEIMIHCSNTKVSVLSLGITGKRVH